jgi:hypothetical protein
MRYSAFIELSNHSVRIIVHEDLDFHPYKTAIAPGLNNRDVANFRISSEELLEMLNSDAVANTAQLANEAHLLLSGYFYRQNYCNWTAKNSRELYQNPLHKDKLTPLYRILSFRVLGPYFFEDESAAVTVTF